MLSLNTDAGGNPPAEIKISESFRECLHCGFVLINKDLKISALNPQVERLFSVKARNLIKNSIRELPDPLPHLISEALETGKNVINRQIVLTNEGKLGRSCLINASLIQTSEEDRPSLILLISDHGLICQIEENVRRLDRLASIGILSTSVAHEIKNAMQSMSTFVDTFTSKAAQARIMQEPDEKKLMELAGFELKRILGLVNQMLRYSGPDKPSRINLHLHEIISQTLALVRHQLEGRKIKLQLNLDAEDDLVAANSNQLEQAFLNLFLNAVEAMPPGGRLILRTAYSNAEPRGQERAFLEFDVQDTGVGIAPENFPHIFDTFFTTKKEGTGLGLSITQRIINEHGGTIHIDSQQNAGTTVRIRFPMAADTSPL